MKEFGAWLTATVATMGPVGLFLVALADSAFIPLPQGVDALMIAHAVASPETAWLGALLAVAGSLIGNLVLYSLARKGGRAMLEKRMKPAGIARLEERTARYGAPALIPPMMIPLPLPTKLFVLGAGVFQMSVTRFAAATVIGRAIRYGGEAWLAKTYGDETIAIIEQNLGLAALGAVALVATLFFINKWSTSRVAEGR